MFSAFNYLETRFTSEEKRLSKTAEIWVHPRGNRRKYSKYLGKEKTGMSVTKQSKLCEKSHNSTLTPNIRWANISAYNLTSFSGENHGQEDPGTRCLCGTNVSSLFRARS